VYKHPSPNYNYHYEYYTQFESVILMVYLENV